MMEEIYETAANYMFRFMMRKFLNPAFKIVFNP